MSPGAPQNDDRKRLGSGALRVAVAVLIAGLGGRLALSGLAPRWAYVWDHFDNIGMGLTAARHGLLKVYSVPSERNPRVRGWIYSPAHGEFRELSPPRQPPRVTNYPPLGVTVFYLQGLLGGMGRQDHLANTFTCRLVMSIPSVLAEIVLAVGAFLLTRHLAGPRAGLVAASVCWLMPPLALDSAFWGQTDAWFLAPAVFVVYLTVRGRWTAAGIVWALTILLKPQGILLAPVVLFAGVILPGRQGSSAVARIALRGVKTLVAALLTIAIVTLPWTLADGMTWLDKAYVANFKMYGETTLMAFNVWYADALRLDHNSLVFALDGKAKLAGLTKDTWGRLFLLGALGGLAGLFGWRYRRRRDLALVIFAAMALWSAYIWPTGVHERYVVYGVPLLIVAAARLRRLWPAVAALAVVGAAAMTWNVWLKGPSAGKFLNRRVLDHLYQQYREPHPGRFANELPNQRRPAPTYQQVERLYVQASQQRWAQYTARREPNRPYELLLTVLSLGAYAYAVAAVGLRPPPEAPAGRRKRAPSRRRRKR